MPKVLCRSINLNPLLDSVCQMTNTNSNSIINAPHSDDNTMNGPQLCIVSAALVSGDSDGVDTSGVRFQSTYLPSVMVNHLIFFSVAYQCFFLGSESNDEPSQQHQRDSSPSIFSRTEENNGCSIFLSFNSHQRHHRLIRYQRLHLPKRLFTAAAAAAAIWL